MLIRLVTIAGAIIAAAGLALSATASPENGGVIVLYVTIGIMTGVGFGFIYLPGN